MEPRNIYSVDIPNPLNVEVGAGWVDMGTFGSREEAIIWCQNMFGADEEGRISLISEIEVEEEEEYI